ncbi:MAG: NlpC/P60 family protein [Verrucomicrobiota bacterium]
MLRALIPLVLFSFVFTLLPEASAQLTREQFGELMKTVRWLDSKNIRYREEVRLPGESEPWMMDCSNTVRYIAKDALGLELSRVASGQYWELDQAGKITQAPWRDGRVDTEKLLDQMASGDLIFWEWTYDIKRSPPITHVMIYLGRDKNGIARMAGSSSGKNGGVGVYRFDPNANMGGVRGMFGGYKRKAKFVGFGRLFEMTDHGYSVATLPAKVIGAN